MRINKRDSFWDNLKNSLNPEETMEADTLSAPILVRAADNEEPSSLSNSGEGTKQTLNDDDIIYYRSTRLNDKINDYIRHFLNKKEEDIKKSVDDEFPQAKSVISQINSALDSLIAEASSAVESSSQNAKETPSSAGPAAQGDDTSSRRPGQSNKPEKKVRQRVTKQMSGGPTEEEKKDIDQGMKQLENIDPSIIKEHFEESKKRFQNFEDELNRFFYELFLNPLFVGLLDSSKNPKLFGEIKQNLSDMKHTSQEELNKFLSYLFLNDRNDETGEKRQLAHNIFSKKDKYDGINTIADLLLKDDFSRERLASAGQNISLDSQEFLEKFGIQQKIEEITAEVKEMVERAVKPNAGDKSNLFKRISPGGGWQLSEDPEARIVIKERGGSESPISINHIEEMSTALGEFGSHLNENEVSSSIVEIINGLKEKLDNAINELKSYMGRPKKEDYDAILRAHIAKAGKEYLEQNEKRFRDNNTRQETLTTIRNDLRSFSPDMLRVFLDIASQLQLFNIEKSMRGSDATRLRGVDNDTNISLKDQNGEQYIVIENTKTGSRKAFRVASLVNQGVLTSKNIFPLIAADKNYLNTVYKDILKELIKREVNGDMSNLDRSRYKYSRYFDELAEAVRSETVTPRTASYYRDLIKRLSIKIGSYSNLKVHVFDREQPLDEMGLRLLYEHQNKKFNLVFRFRKESDHMFRIEEVKILNYSSLSPEDQQITSQIRSELEGRTDFYGNPEEVKVASNPQSKEQLDKVKEEFGRFYANYVGNKIERIIIPAEEERKDDIFEPTEPSEEPKEEPEVPKLKKSVVIKMFDELDRLNEKSEDGALSEEEEKKRKELSKILVNYQDVLDEDVKDEDEDDINVSGRTSKSRARHLINRLHEIEDSIGDAEDSGVQIDPRELDKLQKEMESIRKELREANVDIEDIDASIAEEKDIDIDEIIERHNKGIRFTKGQTKLHIRKLLEELDTLDERTDLSDEEVADRQAKIEGFMKELASKADYADLIVDFDKAQEEEDDKEYLKLVMGDDPHNPKSKIRYLLTDDFNAEKNISRAKRNLSRFKAIETFLKSVKDSNEVVDQFLKLIGWNK